MRLGTRANTTHNACRICPFGAMLASVLFVLCIGCASKEEKEAKHQERARQYVEKTEFKNAIAEFQDSLMQNPDNPVINLHLGLAYYKNKQPRKAKEFLDKALNINQNFKGAEEARNILKEIETSASAG